MEKIIVYVDDVSYAQRHLDPLLLPGGQTQWILVACAPRLTRHASQWVSQGARQSWRARWAEKAFAALCPSLQERGDEVTTVVATVPLPELTTSLRAAHGPARVLDARRPKFGHELPAVTAAAARDDNRWQLPGAVAGMGAILVLAAE